MAESPPMVGRASVDPGRRGSLVIEDRVVSRIAGHVALEVPGVARGTGSRGDTFPRVRARVDGDRAEIDVDIAVQWATPVVETARRVQERITSTITELVGLRVTRVGVVVARVVETPDPGRVQ